MKILDSSVKTHSFPQSGIIDFSQTSKDRKELCLHHARRSNLRDVLLKANTFQNSMRMLHVKYDIREWFDLVSRPIVSIILLVLHLELFDGIFIRSLEIVADDVKIPFAVKSVFPESVSLSVPRVLRTTVNLIYQVTVF